MRTRGELELVFKHTYVIRGKYFVHYFGLKIIISVYKMLCIFHKTHTHLYMYIHQKDMLTVSQAAAGESS